MIDRDPLDQPLRANGGAVPGPELQLDLKPALDAAARAYAADMGLSFALLAPEAQERVRAQVWAWLTPAAPYIAQQVVAAMTERHQPELAAAWDAGREAGERWESYNRAATYELMDEPVNPHA